jgi:hypothetical protein
VDLSARQRSLYKALLANVSVADLLEKAANIGDADSARSLMNLVMQFRKVGPGEEAKAAIINVQPGMQSPRTFRACRCRRSVLLCPIRAIWAIESRRGFHLFAILYSESDRICDPRTVLSGWRPTGCPKRQLKRPRTSIWPYEYLVHGLDTPLSV